MPIMPFGVVSQVGQRIIFTIGGGQPQQERAIF